MGELKAARDQPLRSMTARIIGNEGAIEIVAHASGEAELRAEGEDGTGVVLLNRALLELLGNELTFLDDWMGEAERGNT